MKLADLVILNAFIQANCIIFKLLEELETFKTPLEYIYQLHLIVVQRILLMQLVFVLYCA